MKSYSFFIKEDTNSKKNFNSIIEFTNLRDDLNADSLKEVCRLAEENEYYGICILPKYVSLASNFIKKYQTKIVTVVNFPNGKDKIRDILKDINGAIINGCDEIDMVFDYTRLKNVDIEDKDDVYADLLAEVRRATELCHSNGKVIKIIIETGVLSYTEIHDICEICNDASVDFIKTSTGLLRKDDDLDTKLDKVKFIRNNISDNIGIKVSGGIRNSDDVNKFRNYIDRIGTSVVI